MCVVTYDQLLAELQTPAIRASLETMRFWGGGLLYAQDLPSFGHLSLSGLRMALTDSNVKHSELERQESVGAAEKGSHIEVSTC